MVDVSVGKNHGIKFLRRASKTFILGPDLIGSPLKQATVQQKANRVCLDQVLAARNFPGGPKKRDFHGKVALVRFADLMDFDDKLSLFCNDTWADVHKSVILFGNPVKSHEHTCLLLL
jgi:hypothetical protein